MTTHFISSTVLITVYLNIIPVCTCMLPSEESASLCVCNAGCFCFYDDDGRAPDAERVVCAWVCVARERETTEAVLELF